MPQLSKFKPTRIWPILVLLLILANGLILAQTPTIVRYAAALVLLVFLPGWAWLHAIPSPKLNLLEQTTLAVGFSLALTILGTMFTVYVPGELTLTRLLVAINIITLFGILFAWRRQAKPAPLNLHLLALSGVLLMLLLAISLRLPRLGYAEFHEDEAEALMLGVRLFQGENYALFLHRKGPAQMLVPVAFWLLANQTTETLARLPFALSSIFSVITLYLIGRRWFNWQAAVIAGLLWAINGYAIAFGRMVQYQALIFFLGPLSIYCLFLAWKERHPYYHLPAAILLAAALLAHFDALLLLPAAAFLGWLIFNKNVKSTPLHRSGVIISSFSIILFLALLASFYLPYALDPEFKNTTSYLAETRVKPGVLYNNLNLLRRLDRDYSSRFYLPLLAVGLIGFVLSAMTKDKKQTANVWGSNGIQPALLVTLVTLVGTTFLFPDTWQWGNANLAIVPWLLLPATCFLNAPNYKTQAVWLMFGAPLIGYVFLVDDPRTHLYIIYPGATLIAGAGLVQMSRWTQRQFSRFPGASRVPAAMGLALGGLVLLYVSAVFLQTESAFSQLRTQWQTSPWKWVYRDLPEPREYFGYPKREGWKAIGALRAAGQFPGDFRSANEDFIIPIWYNYGQARSCYNTPTQYFVRLNGLDSDLSKPGYLPTGQVERESELRLQILSAENVAEGADQTFALESYIDQFDRQATPQQFATQNQPSQPVSTHFGNVIKLTGFDLPAAVLHPGDTLHLNLHWLALTTPPTNYRAFVHLTDGTTLWAQQDDNPACRLPTSIWRVGQRSLGQFRLTVSPDTPPGRYPLIIGLYRADTLERLSITGGTTGQPGDDFLWLGDVEIMP